MAASTLTMLLLSARGYELEFDVVSSAIMTGAAIEFTDELIAGDRIGRSNFEAGQKPDMSHSNSLTKLQFIAHKLEFSTNQLRMLLTGYIQNTSHDPNAALPADYIDLVMRWSFDPSPRDPIVRPTSIEQIGPFPAHLGELTECARKAESEIIVLGDAVDYASFGDPEGHTAYMNTILRQLRAEVKVTYLIWGLPAAISSANKLRGDLDIFKRRAEVFLADLKLKHVDQAGEVISFKDMLQETYNGWRGKREQWGQIDSLVFSRYPDIQYEEVKRVFEDGRWDPDRDDAFTVLQHCLHEWVMQQYRHSSLGSQRAEIYIYASPRITADQFFWIFDRGDQTKREAIGLFPTTENALATRFRDEGFVSHSEQIFRDRIKQYQQSKYRDIE